MIHLIEIKIRSYYILLSFLLILSSFILFFDSFLYLLASPLLNNSSFHLIYTDIMEAFVAQIELSLFGSFIIFLPYLMGQVWSFILPGLYKYEKDRLLRAAKYSFIFFLSSSGFIILLVLPYYLSFFSTFDSTYGLHLYFEPKLDAYTSFISRFISFILFFSLLAFPLYIFLLFLTTHLLGSYRSYFYFLSFFLSSLFSPDLSLLLFIFFSFLIFYELTSSFTLFSFFRSFILSEIKIK